MNRHERPAAYAGDTVREQGRRTRRVLNDAAGSPSDAGVAGRQPNGTVGPGTTAIIALAGVVEIAWLGVLTWTAMELTR